MARAPRLLAFTVLTCAAGASAHAQVGSGWTQYAFQKMRIHKEGPNAYYSNSGGVETFRLTSSDNRSEVEMRPKWYSGQQQFQGEVNTRSGSGGTGGSSVQQVFGIAGRNSDAFQLRVITASSGSYRTQTDNNAARVVATGVYGKWTRANIIHDANANRLYVYINGSQKWSGVDGGNAENGHFFKYGIYLRGESNPQAQWRSVKTFRK
jgi:hypothetical protein